jgi:hypothetical protein
MSGIIMARIHRWDHCNVNEADRTTKDTLQVIKYMHKLQELSKVSNRRVDIKDLSRIF